MFLTSVVGPGLMAAAAAGEASAQTATPPAHEFYVWRQYILRNGTARDGWRTICRTRPFRRSTGWGTRRWACSRWWPACPARPVPADPAADARLARRDRGALAARRRVHARRRAVSWRRRQPIRPTSVRRLRSWRRSRSSRGIAVPAATAAKGPRLFELRTYESPGEHAHLAKVRMFSEMGEIEIFKRVGPHAGLLLADAGRAADAEPRLHAGPREHGRPREELGRVPQRSGVEEAFGDARLQRRGHRLQHHDRSTCARRRTPQI